MRNNRSAGEPQRRVAEGMLLTTTLIWGGTFAATKALLDSGLEPMGLLTWRFGIAALAFPLLFFPLLRRRMNVRAVGVGALLGLLLYGGFGLQTIGLDYTSSSRSGFITALYVVMTPFLQVFISRRMPAKRVWISVLLVLVGLWLLTTPPGESLAAGFAGFNTGDLLTLCCALLFALYIVALDRLDSSTDPIAVTAIQLLTVGVLSGIHMALTEPWTQPSSAGDWSLILFLALLASVFTTWCQTNYQPQTTPSRAAIIYTMESVFAAVIGIAFLAEELAPVGYVGGVLILGGLLLVETGGQSQNAQDELSTASPSAADK